MLSVIQKKSYGSVKVFWLDKELLYRKLKKAAAGLSSKNHNVEKVLLFGSLAEGRAGVFSDADIAIIVRDSDKKFIDRPEEFGDYFQGIGVETDLFVYTREEIKEKAGFISRILSKGKVLNVIGDKTVGDI